MFNPQVFFEAGRARSGIALIPVYDTIQMLLSISTRNGNIEIDKGDGSAKIQYSTPKLTDFTVSSSSVIFSYTSAYSGSISLNIKNGLNDVYSIQLGHDIKATQVEKYNILDVESFFGQFPKLYSIMMNEIAISNNNRSIISGDLAKVPLSVNRIYFYNSILNTSSNLYLNLSNYDSFSELKYINIAKIKVIGDLNKLPFSCTFFKINTADTGSLISYSQGKTWNSNFDTLDLPSVYADGNYDTLLNDMANNITSAVGSKIINLKGWRTSASDTSVVYLQSLGFNVQCIKARKILDLPFQNSFTDVSPSSLSIVAGNGNGLPSFIAGRKGTDYAVDFGGTKPLKTAINLPLNSDKLSIAFWMRCTVSTEKILLELNTDYNTGSTFLLQTNTASGKYRLIDHTTSNSANSGNIGTINIWNHYVMTVDRGNKTVKMYKNKVLDINGTTSQEGNYGNFPLFIGARNGALTGGFQGQIADLTIWNYPISQSEINDHYNR